MSKSYLRQWQRKRAGMAGWALAGLAIVALLGGGLAVQAAEPLNITAINQKTGTVTAKETAGARQFEFQVTDKAMLRSLRVGQKVSADFQSMTVTLPSANARGGAVRYRMAASSRGFRGGLPVRAGTPGPNDPRRADCKGEWRCTTVSTGSDPGPGDDTISCVCIN